MQSQLAKTQEEFIKVLPELDDIVHRHIDILRAPLK